MISEFISLSLSPSALGIHILFPVSFFFFFGNRVLCIPDSPQTHSVVWTWPWNSHCLDSVSLTARITCVSHHTWELWRRLQIQVRTGIPLIPLDMSWPLCNLSEPYLLQRNDLGRARASQAVLELGRGRHLLKGRAAEEIMGPKLRVSEWLSLQCGQTQTTSQSPLSLSTVRGFLTEEKGTQSFLFAAELSPFLSAASSWRPEW